MIMRVIDCGGIYQFFEPKLLVSAGKVFLSREGEEELWYIELSDGRIIHIDKSEYDRFIEEAIYISTNVLIVKDLNDGYEAD